MSSKIYCVKMNGEIIGYTYGDFSYQFKPFNDEDAYEDAYNAILKIFNNMGFESDDEYFNIMYPNNKCIKDLTRDVTGTIIYYKVWWRRQEDPILKIRMASKSFSNIDSCGRYYSYTNIDKDISKMIKSGNPCMFLIQPKIKECRYEIGKDNDVGSYVERTVPPDAVWFCEDWGNKIERRKLEYWFYQLTHEGKRLCSLNEPHWPTDNEVRWFSLLKWGNYDEDEPETKNKTSQQTTPNRLHIVLILLTICLILMMAKALFCSTDWTSKVKSVVHQEPKTISNQEVKRQ